MLLEREDVNPNQTDTEHGRTSLSWAAGSGHVGVVKLLLQRKDIHTSPIDNKNQTPLSWARSEGHDEVVRILQEPDNNNSGTTNPGCQESPPPSTGYEGESVSGIQLLVDPCTVITDLPLTDPGEQDGVSDINVSVPGSTGGVVPLAGPSTQPQPTSISPPEFSYPPSRTDTTHNTRPTLSLAVDRYIIIASFVCLLAILVYTLPSSSDLFSFHK
ncbi:hypothetical protein HOY80DRAFT_954876 [Tuber brumale]|nr:hypothetical protein HOY80DRAFT_954876 [Tuber brumale]